MSELKLGQVIEMPDGTWRVDAFCDEPDTGLVVLDAVEPKRARGIVAPVSWVEGYLRAKEERDAFEKAGDDLLNSLKGAEESIAKIMLATFPGTILAALDPLAPWFREWVTQLKNERDEGYRRHSDLAQGVVIPLQKKLSTAAGLMEKMLEYWDTPNTDEWVPLLRRARVFLDDLTKTKEELAAEHEQKLQAHLDTLSGCRASRDGDCVWNECPQLKDGEPKKSGRHCPLDEGRDDG